MNISGNKILITGASTGIGKAIALAFLERDNDVIAVGRNRKALEELAAQHSRVIPFECDLALASDVERLVSFIQQWHTDTNILINNAGIQYNYAFGEDSGQLAAIEHEVQINLLAPLRLSSMLYPLLAQQANAAIVNISSGLAVVPKSRAAVYCATKAGIHSFSKSFRYTSGKVKIFEILPPLVDTAMTKGRGKGKITPRQLAEEFIKAFKNDVFEVRIGKVKLLMLINRISPALAEYIMKRAE